MTKDKKKAIEERLAAIGQLHGGLITPEAVVQDATDPDSPLHDQFEWDDSIAAAKHRLWQARCVISSVTVKYEVESKVISTPRYVHDPKLGGTQGYIEVASARSEKDVARDVVSAELGRVEAALERARSIAGALGISVEQALADMIERAQATRAKVAA